MLVKEKEREHAARLRGLKEKESSAEQKELEKTCMEEVDGRSRMSEETPPMTTPIIDLLEYTGVTERTDQILLEPSPQIPGIDEYMQLYIDQLRSVEGCLPKPAKPASFQQYCDEVKQL
eukprot:11925880-Ditylum_brightwellii.AAC.1